MDCLHIFVGEVVRLGWFLSEARHLLAPVIIEDVFDGTHDGRRALDWAVVMAKRRGTSEGLVDRPESGCFLCSSGHWVVRGWRWRSFMDRDENDSDWLLSEDSGSAFSAVIRCGAK